MLTRAGANATADNGRMAMLPHPNRFRFHGVGFYGHDECMRTLEINTYYLPKDIRKDPDGENDLATALRSLPRNCRQGYNDLSSNNPYSGAYLYDTVLRAAGPAGLFSPTLSVEGVFDLLKANHTDGSWDAAIASFMASLPATKPWKVLVQQVQQKRHADRDRDKKIRQQHKAMAKASGRRLEEEGKGHDADKRKRVGVDDEIAHGAQMRPKQAATPPVVLASPAGSKRKAAKIEPGPMHVSPILGDVLLTSVDEPAAMKTGFAGGSGVEVKPVGVASDGLAAEKMGLAGVEVEPTGVANDGPAAEKTGLAEVEVETGIEVV